MRIKNSIRNIFAGILMQITVMILNFVSRAVFVKILSIEYLGVNGLFTDILSMLNLAELGIGSVIIYSLYKPLAIDDKNKVASYVRFYKVAYNTIGLIIFAAGMIITPFLHVFVKEVPNIPNLQFIYILFLLDTCSTYFFGYKSAILQADQKKYILSAITILQQVASNIAMIVILIATRNFILYLIVRVLMHVLQNIFTIYIVNKKYSYLKKFNDQIRLAKEDKKVFFSNLRKVVVSKIGDYCVLSTDNLIMSYYLGVYYVGLISNYGLIIKAVNGLVIQIFDGITASFGNLLVTETAEKKYSVFKIIMFVNFWIMGFCTVCLYVLINPFISLWLGQNYIIEQKIVSLLVLNFFILGMRTSINIPRNTSGLFTKDSYASMAEAAINLFFSILLVKRIGIAGVLIGTTISAISVQFFTVPYFSYKYVFKVKQIEYYAHYFKYFAVTILALAITKYFCSVLFIGTSVKFFAIKLAACCILPNSIFLFVFRKTEQFIYLRKQISTALQALSKRR